MKRIFHIFICLMTILVPFVTGCVTPYEDEWTNPSVNKPGIAGERVPSESFKHTFLILSLGHNNLSSALEEDINDMKNGVLPTLGRSDDIMLVFSHKTPSWGDYSSEASPALIRLYRTSGGKVIADTVKVWPGYTISASGETISEVLEYVKSHYPSRDYGILLSSHSTGYLPAGFYANPDSYVFGSDGLSSGMMQYGRYAQRGFSAVPYREAPLISDGPLVKTIGQDQHARTSYEMEIEDFAAAIPVGMNISYIIFDACLVGGIEVAYSLKDKCGMLAFSQTEVLSDGFPYTTMGERIFNQGHNVKGICEDFFQHYDAQTNSSMRSATISLVDCSGVDRLADVCKELFDKYRNKILQIDASSVQKYFRYSYHWFYDLRDILVKCNITQEELEKLDEALQECVIYANATPAFMAGSGGFSITTHCGLSMYLPGNGHPELNKYYRTLPWNIKTSLVSGN